MANLGYLQVVRHCNHVCGFCSNPTTPYSHDLSSMKTLVDDFVERGYFGIILTGGEPTLHPELPAVARYARDRGLHVRMITNGHRLAERPFAEAMADAGLQLVHVSIYSVDPGIEAELRGTEGTLDRAFAAIDNALSVGLEVNINCVINRMNSSHLDRNVKVLTERFPGLRHFVWNNLDPSMGRAEVNQEQYTPRLADFELSLHRAMRHLHKTGRTFRVEKVPLCYMTDFAWASTETRKIVKGEERIVYFLDAKQGVRQTEWDHLYAPGCARCTLREICGGLFDRGDGYDPAELAPVFVDRDQVVETILNDASDPARERMSLDRWREVHAERVARAKAEASEASNDERKHLPVVGQITDKSMRRFEAKRRAEGKRTAERNLQMERLSEQLPSEPDER
ncbi:MAG: radical SAM protein [Deltaproteobacteria bacterium]|nr:radical SAM protein [Deltaproteobacteria bacterium]